MIEIVEQGAQKVGGVTKLADALGIKRPSFYSWKQVPAERVLDFERITGIPRSEIRPDLYPAEDLAPSIAVDSEAPSESVEG